MRRIFMMHIARNRYITAGAIMESLKRVVLKWEFHLGNYYSAHSFQCANSSRNLCFNIKPQIQIYGACIDIYMYILMYWLVSSQALGRWRPWCVQSEDSNHDPADSRQEVPQFWLCGTWLLPWPGPQRVQTLALPGKIQNEAPHHCSKDTNILYIHSETMHSSSPGKLQYKHTPFSAPCVSPWLMFCIVLQFGEPELIMQHIADFHYFLAGISTSSCWPKVPRVPIIICRKQWMALLPSAVCLCVCCGVLIRHVSSIRALY